MRTVFYELGGLNVLRLAESESEEIATFGFERIRAYIYATMIKKWQRTEASLAVADIQTISENHLGLETVEFYFTHIDRGQTELLTEIAISNLDLFIHLVSHLEFKSSIKDIEPEKQADAYFKRLEQFTIAHSKIKHVYFPNLRTRILPYSDGDTGVWVTPNASMFQLRKCTEQYPHKVVVLDERLAAMAHFGNSPPIGFSEALGGTGVIHLGTNDLLHKLPQKFAWDIILKDLSNLFEHRDLYIGENPSILQEKIWDTLLYNPSTWSAGDPESFKRYFEVLGYSDPENVKDMPIGNLLDKIPEYLSAKTQIILDNNLREQDRRSAEIRYKDMNDVGNLLNSLAKLTPVLEKPRFRRQILFEIVRDKSKISEARHIVTELVDCVFAEYRSLLELNFPGHAIKFSLYNALDNENILVEAAIMPDDDRTSLVYALLPTEANLPSNRIVVVNHADWILQSLPFRLNTWSGYRVGGNFANANLNLSVDGIRIREPNATLYRTKIDLGLPITTQVHQLIGVEANEVFGADWHTSGFE